MRGILYFSFLFASPSPVIFILIVFLSATIVILLVSLPATFLVLSVVGLSHIIHKLAKLPVLDERFNLPFQIMTFICLVTMVFVVLTVVIFVPYMTRGLHSKRRSEDSPSLRGDIDLFWGTSVAEWSVTALVRRPWWTWNNLASPWHFSFQTETLTLSHFPYLISLFLHFSFDQLHQLRQNHHLVQGCSS